MVVRAQDDDDNGDGVPDLAVVSTGNVEVGVLLGAGTGSFAAQVTFAVGKGPAAVAAGDFAGKGRLDLAVANENDGTVGVLLNLGGGQGTGSFAAQVTYGVGSQPTAIAVGDFNDDGRLDLAVPSQEDNSVSVWLGEDGGLFDAEQGYDVGGGPTNAPLSVAVGDFNGAGWPDLAFANSYTNDVGVLLNLCDGGGFFSATPTTYAAGTTPVAVVVGDFNGDGRLDLAVANAGTDQGGTVSLLLNQGDGGFAGQVSFAVGKMPSALAEGDLNGNGRLDLVVVNFSDRTLSVLLNDGDGGFDAQTTYSVGNSPQSVAVGDFNGDGRPDLAVANQGDETVGVLMNRGDGGFSTQATYAVSGGPYSIAVGDFNGDGEPDLAVAGFGNETVSLLLNQGGTFATALTFAVGNSPGAVAVGDFNRDGRPDLAVANYFDGTVSVLLNVCSP